MHDEDPSEGRADRALQLLGFPFTEEEERWFEDCLLHGTASKSPMAKDSLTMRRFAKGKLESAENEFTSRRGNKQNGIDWAEIRKIAAG